MESNGCPECKKLGVLCLACELESAEWEVARWMKMVENIKQAIKKEKEQNELSNDKR